MKRPGRTVALTCAAATIFGVGAVAASAGVASADAPDCRNLVIGVGGNGQHDAEMRGAPTMMGAHLDAYAAQGYRVQSLDYPAGVWPTASYTKDESVADGAIALDRAISDYRAECPGGHVTVVAHSLGSEFADTTVADKVILYGDPRRPQGGIYGALPGVWPGTSNPGLRAPGDNTVNVCHQYDGICDNVAPWADPARFIQGMVGYVDGHHFYAPGEGADLPPGDYYIPEPAPVPWLPTSTPTGLPEQVTPMPLPTWEPGPLPSLADFDGLVDALTPDPYRPTPLSDYVPDEVEQYLPAEVLAYVPPPLPAIAAPALPDLGIRLP